MTFLFDENISPHVVESLKPLDKPVVHVTEIEQLGVGAKDEDIFAYLEARPDWFLVTQDQKMRYKKHQCQAMLEAGLGVFIFTGKTDKTNEQMVVFVIQIWSGIEKSVFRTSRPTP